MDGIYWNLICLNLMLIYLPGTIHIICKLVLVQDILILAFFCEWQKHLKSAKSINFSLLSVTICPMSLMYHEFDLTFVRVFISVPDFATCSSHIQTWCFTFAETLFVVLPQASNHLWPSSGVAIPHLHLKKFCYTVYCIIYSIPHIIPPPPPNICLHYPSENRP